jgi:predicted acetyltransferase
VPPSPNIRGAVPDGLTVRLLTEDEAFARDQLSHLAFGVGRPDPERPRIVAPARRWGVLDPDGRLLAKATDREQRHWFGGHLVDACGVAGVAVAPEARGRGLARLVVEQLLDDARSRGAAVATLFRTAPALYRGLGFEHVGTLTWYTTPTSALAGVRTPAGMTLRAATAADVPRVRSLYEQVARTRSGMLEREGPLFPGDAEMLAARDGITLAVTVSATGTEVVEGYCIWDRGTGWNGSARLTVWDLLATTRRGLTALVASLGTWASVLPTVSLRIADPDPVRWVLPVGDLTVESQQSWMLKILDAERAVAQRPWPRLLDATVDLTLTDGDGPSSATAAPDGRCRWSFSGGAGSLSAGGSGEVHLDVRGLSVLYAGGGSAAMLRQAGLLSGPSDADAALDAAAAGPAPALLDFF